MQRWLLPLTLCLCSLTASRALAGGLELGPGGARALARGGAVAAQPSDPMALLHNPAGLAMLKGDQFLLDVDTTFHDMCVDPYGYYGWGVYDSGPSELGDSADPAYARRPLDRVCNSAPVVPVPNIAWVLRVIDGLNVGFGFVSPAFVPGLHFGGHDGTISRDGLTLPTPTRYQMIRQRVVFGLNPTVGVGYRVNPRLYVGATLHVGIVDARTYAVQSLASGTSPHDDAKVALSVSDHFIPAATISVHTRPTDRLDVAAIFRVADSVRATGELSYETATYQRGGVGADQVPFEGKPIHLAQVRVPVPWALTLAGRYHQPLVAGRAREDAYLDPISQERWDVEADLMWNMNARARTNVVQVGDDVALGFRNAAGIPQRPVVVPEEDLSQFTIDRHLVDSVALRVGGSYNPIPGRLALHAGGFWESRGVDPDYANIDSFAFARVGLGVGLTVRLGDVDLRAAYGHIFQEDLEVAPPPHQPRDQADPDDPSSGFDKRIGGEVVEDPDAPAPKDADGVAKLQQTALLESDNRPRRVVNAGKYTADFHQLSVGLTYRF